MDKLPIEIRYARLEDAASISSLTEQLGYHSSSAEIKNRLKNILTSEGHAVYVAYQPSGEVIGWVHVFISLRVESDPFVEIGGLIVAESSRGQGVAKELIHAAQQWTVHQGIDRLRVRSRKKRLGARQFYLGTGFSVVKEQNIFEKNLSSKR